MASLASSVAAQNIKPHLEDPEYDKEEALREFRNFHNQHGFAYQKAGAWMISAATGGNLLVIEYILSKYQGNPAGAITFKCMEIGIRSFFHDVACFFLARPQTPAMMPADQAGCFINPLHIAAEVNNLVFAEHLLRGGFAVDVCGPQKERAIHAVARTGSLLMYLLLREYDADILVRDYLERTPLHVAVEENSLQIVKCLIKDGADPTQLSRRNKSALHMATERANFEMVVEIFKSVFTVPDANEKDSEGKSALHYAVAKADHRTIEWLAKKHADANVKDGSNNSSFFIAVRRGDVATFELLKKNYTDNKATDLSGQTYLHWACLNGSAAMVTAILKSGISPDTLCLRRIPPLVSAVQANRPDIIQILKDAGANLNLTSPTRVSPLMYAIIGNFYEATAKLLELGADLKLGSTKSRTALILAVRTKRPDLVRLVLKYNPPDLDLVDQYRGSAFHYGMDSGSPEIICSLLDAGCDPTLPDLKGRTYHDERFMTRNGLLIKVREYKRLPLSFD